MTRLPLVGKVTAEWNRVRKELKRDFDRRGIRHCEGTFRNCTTSAFLGFAHVNKRRHLGKWDSPERDVNIRLVALLCNNCHDILERRGEIVGGQEVLRLIRAREGFNFFEDMV